MKRAILRIQDQYDRIWLLPALIEDDVKLEQGGEPQSLDKLYVMASPLRVLDFKVISE